MTEPNNGALYAIFDSVSRRLIGGIQIQHHDAPAIRTFGDIASDPNTLVARHPADFSLVRLGYLSVDNELVPDHAVILNGATWAAAQQREQPSDERPAYLGAETR